MGLVLDPAGRPEPYTWVVQYHSGEIVTEQVPDAPERTFSRHVATERVMWMAIAPQHQGLPTQRVRVPHGAQAWFSRRRIKEGSLGVPNSERLVATYTGVGWRWPDGSGAWLWFAPDGQGVCGEEREGQEALIA